MKTLLWYFSSCWISQKVWDLNPWVLDRWLPLHKSTALWVRWFLQQPLLEIAPSGSCLNTNQAWNLKSSWFASLSFDLHSQPLPFIITRHIFWLHHKESSYVFASFNVSKIFALNLICIYKTVWRFFFCFFCFCDSLTIIIFSPAQNLFALPQPKRPSLCPLLLLQLQVNHDHSQHDDDDSHANNVNGVENNSYSLLLQWKSAHLAFRETLLPFLLRWDMVDNYLISEHQPTSSSSQVIVSSSPLPSPPQNPRLRRPSQGRPSPTPDQVALGKKRQQGTSLPNTKNYIPRSGPSPAPAPGDIITELKMQVTVKQDSTPLILNN